MNILSFDIEEWYLEKSLHGGRDYRMRQFDETLEKVLGELDRLGITGTFFCLGKMASAYPEVVRKILAGGHEIACHSDAHHFLTALKPEELQKDTTDALHALEDVCGTKVVGFRAPAFSITPSNAWAVEVLAGCGIQYDASIFPAARDFGGYPSFPTDTPCRISYRGSVLKEYPVTITSMLGKRIAFSGGGYFRLLPYGTVKHIMDKRDYNICYFHLADLIPEQKKMMSKEQYEEYFKEPGTLKNRIVRYLKSNIGSGDAYAKLLRLLNDCFFTSIREAEKQIDWEKTKLVQL